MRHWRSHKAIPNMITSQRQIFRSWACYSADMRLIVQRSMQSHERVDMLHQVCWELPSPRSGSSCGRSTLRPSGKHKSWEQIIQWVLLNARWPTRDIHFHQCINEQHRNIAKRRHLLQTDLHLQSHFCGLWTYLSFVCNGSVSSFSAHPSSCPAKPILASL